MFSSIKKQVLKINAVADAFDIVVKTRKRDLLFKLEKDIIHVDKITRKSCNAIDGMALICKTIGIGLTFNQLKNDLFSL